jgi:hypothetical protein
MRLLQLSTGPDRFLDLHPNVTVVSGLDDDGRRLLVDAVAGLARGVAVGRDGLLEAHGILFDLTEEVLGVLDVEGDGIQPVVRASDLPALQRDPRARERMRAERALAELDERVATAAGEHRRLLRARDEAAAHLEHARRNAHEAEAGAAERIRLIDELTAQLDQADERRRRLLEAQVTKVPEAAAAARDRADTDAATAEVRTRHQEAAILCSQLAGELDQARTSLEPVAVAEAEAAAEELARIQAEVDAARAAEAERVAAASDGPVEPPSEWLARVQARIEDLEKRVAAFGPTDALRVAEALAQLRARQDGELVPSAPALELADQLEVLDSDLTATSGVGATSQGLAVGRARHDAARQALTEAEQAVRLPQLDRALVERLELAHADVLEAIEKADGRFAGTRAARRVDAARAVEHALLDELGFTSYSDYMMGNSLLNVDPGKEAQLESARAELSAAEDEWRLLEAGREAELARAERMERRRLLLDEASAVLGHRVTAEKAVGELRALRVPAPVPPELVQELQHRLDEAGVALGDEDLSRDELLVVAEAWLDEVDSSVEREQGLRRELAELSEERLEALAAVEAAGREDTSAEDEREDRLRRARADLDMAEARRRNHLEAEAAVAAVSAELAAAVETERQAALAAADADRAIEEADRRAAQLQAEVLAITEELEALGRQEVEANEHLQSLTALENASPEDLARAVRDAEAAYALADDRVQAAAGALAGLEADRTDARAQAAALDDTEGAPDDRPMVEELEWYLLARLAAQRSACLGGSLPLLLDDALVGLDEDQVGHLLGRLERMADAVQVIVVSEDEVASAWAEAAGPERAAAVEPQPA